VGGVGPGRVRVEIFDLFKGLRTMSRRGILIWATTAGRGGPTTTYPRAARRLRLSRFRVCRGWEGQPAANVQQRMRDATVHGWHLDVRVYFATQHPSRTLRVRAQAQLDRLLPPSSR
jgi:hypothetical protein